MLSLTSIPVGRPLAWRSRYRIRSISRRIRSSDTGLRP